MDTFRSFRFVVAITVACCVCVPAFAQSEKVGLRMVPQPNQVLRMRMIQETQVEMTFEGNLAPGPVTLVTKTTFGITQKSGAISADGRIEAEMIYDEVRTEATMNGQVMPTDAAGNNFIGKNVKVTFDKDGDVVDIKVPVDVGVPEESFKQMLTSMYGNMPAMSLAVGEMATVPLDFTLPLPLPGAPPVKMDGEVKHKLVSIQKESAGRIANFDHTIAGRLSSDMEMPVPNGKVKATLDFNLNGGGNLVRDLDHGFVRSSETSATFEGKIKIQGDANAPQIPSVSLHGSTKTTTTSGN